MKLMYIGRYTSVVIGETNQSVGRGHTVEVSSDMGKRLLTQEDEWREEKAPAKKEGK